MVLVFFLITEALDQRSEINMTEDTGMRRFLNIFFFCSQGLGEEDAQTVKVNRDRGVREDRWRDEGREGGPEV